MPALVRTKTGAFQSRQRIPKDVADDHGRLYGQRHEVKLYLPASTSEQEAKQLHAEWIATNLSRVKAIRAARDGTGLSLTQREAVALSGEWYRWWLSQYEEAPGSSDVWDAAFWAFIDELQQHAPDEVRAQAWSDLEWTRDPDVRAGVRPKLVELAQTARFLAGKGIALTREAHALFLDCVLARAARAG
jgi:hypothetical protein